MATGCCDLSLKQVDRIRVSTSELIKMKQGDLIKIICFPIIMEIANSNLGYKNNVITQGALLIIVSVKDPCLIFDFSSYKLCYCSFERMESLLKDGCIQIISSVE